MNGLLDTSVVIDLIRHHKLAVDWIVQQPSLGVSAVVWMEIINGSRNKAELLSEIKLLNRFTQIVPTEIDFSWGISQATQFRLSHNIDPLDCLIAASSQRLQLPLYTLNLKHFVPLIGALAQKPY